MENGKNKKMSAKRILSLLMSIVLIMGMTPTTSFALAAGYEITNPGADDATELPKSLQNGQIWTDKSVSYDKDGVFNITLRAIGQKYMLKNPLPRDLLDVVFVLDVSGSMDNENEDPSKLDSMTAAAKNAVETIYSVEGNRVAIIKYSEYAEVVQDLILEEDLSDEEALNEKIDALVAEGGTNIQHAFYTAQALLEARVDETRKPVIILMSDGRPTYYYDGLIGQSSYRQGTGASKDTTGKHVWNTVLQAMEAKEEIDNLKIYTIGFDVGSDEYAIATLMPDEINMSNYDLYQMSGDRRSRSETYEHPYYWSGGKWNPSERYVSRNFTSQNGSWQSFGGVYPDLSDSWSEYTTDFDTIKGTFSNGETDYTYFMSSRTGFEYRRIQRAKIDFDHKYWEDGSTVDPSTAQDIFDAFVEIVNSLLVMKPNSTDISENYTDIRIKDVLGDAFEVYGDLPLGLLYDEVQGVVTWTIDGDDFTAMSPDEDLEDDIDIPIDLDYLYTKTFQVKIKDDTDPGTYYTNDNSIVDDAARTHSIFYVALDNPKYEASGEIVTDLNNTGWLSIIAPDVEASITIQKTVSGPVSNAARTFKFDIYTAQTNGVKLNAQPIEVTVTGASSNSATYNFSISNSDFNGGNAISYFVEELGDAPDFWTYNEGYNPSNLRREVTIKRTERSKTVNFQNIYEPEGEVTVFKTWSEGAPKVDIKFILQKEVASTEGGTTWVQVGASSHLIEAGAIDGVIIGGLEMNVNYRVMEMDDNLMNYNLVGAPEVFAFNGSTEVLTKEITLLNNFNAPKGTITVVKNWNDAESNAEFRPETLDFTITYPDLTEKAFSMDLDDAIDADTWEESFEVSVDGTFTVTETEPLDYDATANNLTAAIDFSSLTTREATVIFNNTYVKPYGTLTIEKKWSGDEDTDNVFRPPTIAFKILKNGQEIPGMLPIILPEDDDSPWVTVVENLELDKAAGISYSVVEIEVPDYISSDPETVVLKMFDDNHLDSERSKGITITNTFENPTGTILIQKKWDDFKSDEPMDISVVRPTEIIVTLYKDTVAFGDTFALNAGNNWSKLIEELPLDGSVYTVTETAEGDNLQKLNQYSRSIVYTGEAALMDNIQITPTKRTATATLHNTYYKGTVAVYKDWKHGENPLLERPTAAEVTLYARKLVPVESYVEPTGEAEVFSVETLDASSTESLDAPLALIPVELKDVEIGTLTISDPLVPAIFYNLDVSDAYNETITYFVTEKSIPFYDTEIGAPVVLSASNQNDKIIVTNKYSNPKGKLIVTKGWDHNDNPNGPTSVSVMLYKNGNPALPEPITFTGSYTFEKLDLGSIYTVKEVKVDNYDDTYTGDTSYTPVKGATTVAAGNVLIFNTYIPEKSAINFEKIWKDNAGGSIAGVPIQVTLLRKIGNERDANFSDSQNLNSEYGWTHRFEDLEIYGPGGLRYEYYVVESGAGLSLFKETNTQTVFLNVEEESALTITNTYEPEVGTLKVMKKWLGPDGEAIDAPESEIFIKLVVNGVPETITYPLSAQNGWVKTFYDLNVENEYSVMEVTRLEAFEVTYSNLDNIDFDAAHLDREITIFNRRTVDNPKVEVDKTVAVALKQLSNGLATFDYTVLIKNTGNRTLYSLLVTDEMDGPEGATLVYNPAPTELLAGVATFDLNRSLAPGETATFNYSVTVNRAGTYDNLATGTGYFIEDLISDTGVARAVATNPTTPNPDPDPDPQPNPDPQGVVTVTFVDTEGVVLSAGYQMVGTVGTNYVTSARDIEGYTLTETPANANGTFISNGITVTYIYSEEAFITPEDTPLGEAEAVPTVEPTTEAELVIEEEDTPLADALPQTGQLPAGIYLGLGSIVSAIGVYMRRQRDGDSVS